MEFMGSIRNSPLNEGGSPFFSYTCGHPKTNLSSDNEVINKISSKLFVNNVSDNQIVANSLTVLDKSPQSTTSVDDGENENPQFSSAYDKNNDYICLHELLSGFPDVS